LIAVKKLMISAITFCFMMMTALGAVPAHAEPTEETPALQLTEQQKGELKKLHKQILALKKEVVGKYVEYGALPKEKGDMLIKHFEKHYKMLEENGFLLKWDRLKKKQEHEE
jgi:hypothetical protein